MQPRNRIIGGLGVLGSLLLALFKDILFGWLGELGIAMLPADTPNIFIQTILPYLPALLVFILGISAIMGWGAKTTVHFTKPFSRSKLIQPEDTLSPAQGEHNPSRISMIELLNIAASRGWQFKGQSDKHRKSFARSLAQAGIDGRIKFCGAPYENIVELTDTPTHKWLPMASDYWKEWGFNPDTFIDNGLLQSDNMLIITEHDSLGAGAGSWTDIQVDRKQALNWLAHEVAPKTSTPLESVSTVYESDWCIGEAMDYIAKKLGYEHEDLDTKYYYPATLLTAKARAGGIQVWGKRMLSENTAELSGRKFSATDWEDRELLVWACQPSTRRAQTRGVGPSASSQLTDLHVSQRQIESVDWRLEINQQLPSIKQFDDLDSAFYLPEGETTLTGAIFLMVNQSTWGRERYATLFSADNEDSYVDGLGEALQDAAMLVRQAAIKGQLTIYGTVPNTSNQKPIPSGDWRYAVLDVEPIDGGPWHVVATPNLGDSDLERDNRAWRYEDLTVDSLEFEKNWPGEDL